jgi:hypothetical protein
LSNNDLFGVFSAQLRRRFDQPLDAKALEKAMAAKLPSGRTKTKLSNSSVLRRLFSATTWVQQLKPALCGKRWIKWAIFQLLMTSMDA